ncbi:MAG: GlsB/YeaQ/YmgE family stress response membrane protein [Pseudomonadota bacterium]
MDIQSLVLFLVIGLVAGWLASQIMRGGGFGLLGDMIVGVIGALLGGWMFGLLGVSLGGGLIGALLTALIGAIVLLYLLRLIKRA